MNEKTVEACHPVLDPNLTRYWMKQGPKPAAFLLVNPGCTVIGYGWGQLADPPPFGAIGFGAGLVVCG